MGALLVTDRITRPSGPALQRQYGGQRPHGHPGQSMRPPDKGTRLSKTGQRSFPWFDGPRRRNCNGQCSLEKGELGDGTPSLFISKLKHIFAGDVFFKLQSGWSKLLHM